MELYIEVMFWLGVVGSVLRGICIGFTDYPREVGRGTDAVGGVISTAFLIWAAVLLWA